MKINTILIAILLIFLTVGAVSANDENITSDELTVADDVSGDILDVESSADEVDILEEDSAGSFSELSGLIEDASENGTLELNKDYCFSDNSSHEGIKIAKSLTIDGKGHTVSSKVKFDFVLFNISKEANVTLRNIVFKDLDSKSKGIFCFEGSGNLINCSFNNCWGANTVSFGDSFNVVNCSFYSCSKIYSSKSGTFMNNSFIYGSGKMIDVGNGTFINNAFTRFYSRYSNLIYAGFGNFINNIFTDCGDDEGKEIIYIGSGNFINNTFTDCGRDYGNEIIHMGSGNFTNNTFTRCKCESNLFWFNSATIVNSTFINCSSSDFCLINGGTKTSSGTIINSTFINCECDYYIISLNPLNVINCSFINSSKAVYLKSGNVADCSFVNCAVTPIYSSGNIVNCSFVRCGNIVADLGNVVNCSFRLSRGTEAGAIDASSHVSILNCDFVNCFSENIGGRYYAVCFSTDWENSPANQYSTIGNCNFIGSSWLSKSGKVKVYNVNFTYEEYFMYESENGTLILNVTVDRIPLDYYFLNVDEDYAHVNLTRNYTLENSPLFVSANNVVIDGNGHYIESDIVDRAFRITGNNVTIKNINFRGLGLYIHGSYCNIINCTFFGFRDIERPLRFIGASDKSIKGFKIMNCSFGNYYSGEELISIVSYTKDVEISNCHFMNMTKAIDYRADGCNISDCDFTRCERPIYMSGKSVLISNCNIMDSTSEGQGSLRLGSGDYKIVNCTFENNQKYRGYAGAVYCYSADCTIINCKFKNNTIKNSILEIEGIGREAEGRAIYFDNTNYRKLAMINCSFEGNDWFSDIPVELSNVTVDGIKVSLWDSLEEYSRVNITKDYEIPYSSIPIITDNIVIDGRGHTIKSHPYWGLYVTGRNVTLKNFIFNGANLYSSGANFTIMDCNFVNCSSDNRGGLYCKGGKIINCNFTNCSTYNYGFIYSESNRLFIINCNFINATESRNPMIYSTLTSVVNTTFINCFGGAIVTSWISSIYNCSFVNCQSLKMSTTIYCMSRCDIADCRFVNCSGSRCGAIYSEDSHNIFSSCSFMDCRGEYGGAIYGIFAEVSDCIFKNCVDANNNAIYIFTGSNLVPVFSNLSFVGCHWYSNDNVKDFSDITVDNVSYSPNLNIIYDDDNLTIELVDDETRYSPIYINGNNIVIDGKGNTLSGNANYVLYIRGNNVTVKNANFKNAAIHSKSDTTIINCNFSDFKYFSGSEPISSSGDVINCSFVNCHGDSGGAIRGAMDVINCRFVNCSTFDAYSWGLFGGAIRGARDVVNCSFVNCFSHGGGDAIYGASNVINCSFTNTSGEFNREHGNEGCVSHSGSVINSTFNNFWIGVAYSGKVVGCKFIEGSGGAVCQSGDVFNSTFINCRAACGGAIYAENNRFISGCSFINCSSEGMDKYGGAIYAAGFITVEDCNFTDCFAYDHGYRDDFGGFGGAVYVSKNGGRFTDCNFVRCSSVNGGAIYVDEKCTDCIISNCNFMDCFVVDYWLRLYLDYGVYIKGGNTAVDGNVRLENSTFWGCGWTTADVYNVTLEKIDSSVYVSDQMFDYDDIYPVYAILNGVDNLNVSVINHPEAKIMVNMTFNRYPAYYISKAEIKISDLSAGSYRLNITTVPRSYFYPVSILANMTINKANSSFYIKDNLTLPYNNTARYTVVLEGADSFTAYVDDCDADVAIDGDSIMISGLNAGNYTLHITTIPDENHYGATGAVQIFMPKMTPNMSVKANNIKYGETAKIEVSLDVNLNAAVILEFNGQTHTKLLQAGKATFDISGLKAGQYTAKVTLPENVNYDALSASKTFEVSKFQIGTYKVTKTIKQGPFTVIFQSDATGNVSITIDSETYSAALVNGQAKIYLPLGNGEYTYGLVYSGDDKYYGFTKLNRQLTIDRAYAGTIIPEVVVPPVDAVYGGDSILVHLPDDATGTVTLRIGGANYEFTVASGFATVTMPYLSSGLYPYTITYSGDGKYTSFVTDGSLKINDPNPPSDDGDGHPGISPSDDGAGYSGISASNAKVVYSSGSYYSIKIYGKQGIVSKGVRVVIKVKGKVFKTLTADAKGTAKFKVTQAPGTYKMTISALGKSLTRTLTVKHLVSLKSVTVKKSAKKLVLTAALGKINKKYPKGKKVNFKFNGKKYSAKIDKKGVAKVTIKSKVLKKLKVGKKVTYQATYLKDTVKKTATVKK